MWQQHEGFGLRTLRSDLLVQVFSTGRPILREDGQHHSVLPHPVKPLDRIPASTFLDDPHHTEHIEGRNIVLGSPGFDTNGSTVEHEI